MTFSEELLKTAQPWWQGSLEHPFIQELGKGTLPIEIFKYYLIQDNYYLHHFSKIHELVAQNTDNPTVKSMMIEGSESLAAGELAIRSEFFEKLNISSKDLKETPIAPTAYNYVSHMYRQFVENGSDVAFAALMPCSWLYLDVGLKLAQKGSPDAIYQQWIDTYASEDLKQSVVESKKFLDDYSQNLPIKKQQQIIDAFKISTIDEYNFWQMSMDQETYQMPKY